MKKKNIKPKLKKIIAIILLGVIIGSIAGAVIVGLNSSKIDSELDVEIPIVEVQEDQDQAAAITDAEGIVPKEEDIQWSTMYTTTGVNIRIAPSLEALIYKIVPINTELQIATFPEEFGDPAEGWKEIQLDDGYYYIYADYLSETKTVVQTTSRGINTRVTTSKSGALTKSKGVNYYNGHKETWYSQRVLPGGGLKIPGRHVAEDGTIRDENDYICVASSDYAKGTVVETSLGTGKVYDCGCASGTIDIYTDW